MQLLLHGNIQLFLEVEVAVKGMLYSKWFFLGYLLLVCQVVNMKVLGQLTFGGKLKQIRHLLLRTQDQQKNKLETTTVLNEKSI